MAILFDSSRPVKPASRFGSGLLAWTPTYRAPFTADDAAWWAAQNNAEPDWDAMAADAMAQDSLDRGVLPL